MRSLEHVDQSAQVGKAGANKKFPIYIFSLNMRFPQSGMCDLQRLRPACAYA